MSRGSGILPVGAEVLRPAWNGLVVFIDANGEERSGLGERVTVDAAAPGITLPRITAVRTRVVRRWDVVTVEVPFGAIRADVRADIARWVGIREED